MYEVTSFKAEHGLAIGADLPDDPAVKMSVGQWGGAEWGEVEKKGEAYTLLKDGKPIGIAGVYQRHHGCWAAWMIRSKSLRGADMLPVHRFALRFLDDFLYDDAHRRVEITVLASFPAAIRWARMLGFEREGLMRCYDPAGQDHWLYSRVRNN